MPETRGSRPATASAPMRPKPHQAIPIVIPATNRANLPQGSVEDVAFLRYASMREGGASVSLSARGQPNRPPTVLTPSGKVGQMRQTADEVARGPQTAAVVRRSCFSHTVGLASLRINLVVDDLKADYSTRPHRVQQGKLDAAARRNDLGAVIFPDLDDTRNTSDVKARLAAFETLPVGVLDANPYLQVLHAALRAELARRLDAEHTAPQAAVDHVEGPSHDAGNRQLPSASASTNGPNTNSVHEEDEQAMFAAWEAYAAKELLPTLALSRDVDGDTKRAFADHVRRWRMEHPAEGLKPYEAPPVVDAPPPMSSRQSAATLDDLPAPSSTATQPPPAPLPNVPPKRPWERPPSGDSSARADRPRSAHDPAPFMLTVSEKRQRQQRLEALASSPKRHEGHHPAPGETAGGPLRCPTPPQPHQGHHGARPLQVASEAEAIMRAHERYHVQCRQLQQLRFNEKARRATNVLQTKHHYPTTMSGRSSPAPLPGTRRTMLDFAGTVLLHNLNAAAGSAPPPHL